MEKKYVIGADFGSDSVRAVVINTEDGSMCSEAVCEYPRWKQGLYQQPDISLFRQHPLDYLEALESVVKEAVRGAGKGAGKRIAGLAVDTTGSTPCPVDEHGTPLALLPGFSENGNAMFHLWKDHTAAKEAIELNKAFSDWKGTDYTKYQGTYSSEWYWAKVLRTSRLDERVRNAAFGWVEHCDWITGELVGNTAPSGMYRCSCAAGHKALWHSEWGGLPAAECLEAVEPCLGDIARHFGRNVRPAGVPVGRITEAWAERLGLPEDTVVGGCSFDAHAGAVGAGVRPGTLVVNIGTSAVDMMVERAECLKGKNLAYACGMAEDSILPGYTGIEAGQAAFGDVYAWLKQFLMWPCGLAGLTSAQKEELGGRLLAELTRQAEKLEIEPALTALDWFNGRRYPYANEFARGALLGLSLGTDPPAVFQSLVLATVFGLKRIVGSFRGEGLEVERIIAVGGIPQKSPYIMQAMADILECGIFVSASRQACARGAAVFAAVACGAFEDVCAAQEIICEGFVGEYSPREEKKQAYRKAFEKYSAFGKEAEQFFDE